MSKQNKVATNLQQDFTTAEQAQARSNIGAQAQLTAGSNITITDNNVVSAIDTTYQAGSGLDLTGNTFSVSDPIPEHDYTLANKVLTVKSNGTIGWEDAQGGSSSDIGIYEVTVTKELTGTDAKIWRPTDGNYTLTETYINCSSANCPIRILQDDYNRLLVNLSNYSVISCEAHVFVSPNANFATELGEWGMTDLCQVVAGMNRTFFVSNGDFLVQNGIGSSTQTLKTGTVTVKFDFIFNV